MKKDFIEPELEVVRFSIEDLITTSGDGFGDIIEGDGGLGTGGGIVIRP